jgi:anti-anti-sigma regulatory factor
MTTTMTTMATRGRWAPRNERKKLAILIEPVGDLTLELSRRVSEAAHDARGYGRRVVISLRRMPHVSWAALCELADRLIAERGDAGEVRFSDVLPRMRSLMDQVGLGYAWILKESVATERRILLSA